MCATECAEKFNVEVASACNRMSIDVDEGLMRAKTYAKPANRAITGCWGGDTRLFSLYPEIIDMQVRAILGKHILLISKLL